jgi:hypothetical protein
MNMLNEIPIGVFLVLIVALLVLAGGLGLWLVEYIKSSRKESSSRLTVAERYEGAPEDSIKDLIQDSVAEAQSGEVELLRVARTVQGETIVFVQGQPRRHLREIKDLQRGQDTIEALKAVLAFAEGYIPASARPSQSAQTAPPQASPQAPAIGEEEFLERLRHTDLFPAEQKSPGIWGLPKRRRPSEPSSPLITPADQINELVQQRLEEAPHLARYNVHVTTGADGGVCVHVGLQTYAVVDDIPEVEIRALVQDAVNRWKVS